MTTEKSDTEYGSLEVDEFTSWPSSKFGDPIEVEHGIRLSKPIAEAAQSWWSLRWLSIIQQFGLGVRLERAKQYAMRGQVLSIQIENGVVRSQVQGADQEPYRVILAVKTIPRAIWSSILADFASSSSFGIQIASGRLPSEEEISSTFRENGVLLFPDRQGEMQTKCSCLDWSNPCKHIAAVYLLLAAEFERDPLLIFKLRGLSSPDLFALLKSQREPMSEPNASASMVAEDHLEITARIKQQIRTRMEKQGKTVASPPRKQTRDPATFWRKNIKSCEVLDPGVPPKEVASLPHSLGEFPFWQGNEEFLPSMRFVYEVAPEQATRLLAGTYKSDISNS